MHTTKRTWKIVAAVYIAVVVVSLVVVRVVFSMQYNSHRAAWWMADTCDEWNALRAESPALREVEILPGDFMCILVPPGLSAEDKVVVCEFVLERQPPTPAKIVTCSVPKSRPSSHQRGSRPPDRAEDE
jgi:hypothetical protein